MCFELLVFTSAYLPAQARLQSIITVMQQSTNGIGVPFPNALIILRGWDSLTRNLSYLPHLAQFELLKPYNTRSSLRPLQPRVYCTRLHSFHNPPTPPTLTPITARGNPSDKNPSPHESAVFWRNNTYLLTIIKSNNSFSCWQGSKR